MNIIAEITHLLGEHGATRYGENVSQLEHALQTAQLAADDKQSDTLIAACLLHDIGHLHYAEGLASRGIDGEHEHIGADWLRPYFSEAVTEPIRWHVAAKRYLCNKEDGYWDTLSLASKRSLQLQGGPYTDEEASEFENKAFYQDAVQLRRYDDFGKIEDMQTQPLNSYLKLLEELKVN